MVRRRSPLSTDVLERMRGVEPDLPVERVLAEGDEPLRCCLRNARPRGACLLARYEPRLPDSPYIEKGAPTPRAELAAVLAVPGVAVVHSRNVAYGC